jgi:hypothetical protein
MKKFILKSLFFLLFNFAVFCTLIYFSADGYTDPFYLRFTSGKQTSMIIGTSRSAQGIVPTVLNKKLHRLDIYNFSFTQLHSPFGKSYLQLIKKKLNTDKGDGLFIISVDPWSISTELNHGFELFPEEETFTGKLQYVNLNPNLFYLLNFYNGNLLKIILPKRHNNNYLHDDGWLEVTIPMDKKSINERIDSKKKEYSGYSKTYRISKYRIFWLNQTIKFLKQYGDVYLIRLPTGGDISKIENNYSPNFNKIIDGISNEHKVKYFNLISLSDSLLTTDGLHLFKESSELISKIIADSISRKN